MNFFGHPPASVPVGLASKKTGPRPDLFALFRQSGREIAFSEITLNKRTVVDKASFNCHAYVERGTHEMGYDNVKN
jgi:hypothetical protein